MSHDLHYILVIVENCNFVPCIAEERICPARMVEVMDDSCDEQRCQLNGLQLVLEISAHHIRSHQSKCQWYGECDITQSRSNT